MEGTLLVAVAAGAGAVLALAGVLALWVAFRRLRAAQQVLLPAVAPSRGWSRA